MSEADLVVTVGRRLDFQLAYGSPAVFGNAKFLRIADCAGELRDNRPGAAEIFATPSATHWKRCWPPPGAASAAADRAWAETVRGQAPGARRQARAIDVQARPPAATA